jgi:UDP:flavonoid glycosyltransferase YjiC (YdhE family)
MRGGEASDHHRCMPTPDGPAPRVLFACIPQAGHLGPLLPLARQLVAEGGEVIVAGGPSIGTAADAAGLPAAVVGPDLDEWFGRLAARTRGQPGAGLAPERVERYFVPRLFAEIGLDLMADGLSDLVRRWAPELLVFEPYALAAPLVAAGCGVPAVQHTIGLPFDPILAEVVQDAVTPAWVAAGLPAPDADPVALTVDICPPSLAGAAPSPAGRPSETGRQSRARGQSRARRQPMRPVPLPVAGPLPVELPYRDRPLVYLTLGTFSNNALAVFGAALRALADLPVQVLVTAGDDATAAALGEPPDNAVITGFVPQAAILPHCAAVVHHAGAGTTFGLLAHGLPSVALPQSADNFSIARRLAATGTARALMPGTVTVDALRAAVADVLGQASYRVAATRLATEIAAMPPPDHVVTVLRTLARTEGERR